jgi:glutathione S-transferase
MQTDSKKWVLTIGDKNYSTWSMRPWLCLKWAGAAFLENLVTLDQPGYGLSQIADVLAASPTGKVPALNLNGHVIWDSLAIAEWVHEQYPGANLWPEDDRLRSIARSVTAEMHSGFGPLRRDLPMNIRRRCHARNLPAETIADIKRIETIWSTYRRASLGSGKFLFGERSIADAFFVPVATRFRTYGIQLNPVAEAYRLQLLNDPAFLEWEAAALAEETDMRKMTTIDSIYGEDES